MPIAKFPTLMICEHGPGSHFAMHALALAKVFPVVTENPLAGNIDVFGSVVNFVSRVNTGSLAWTHWKLFTCRKEQCCWKHFLTPHSENQHSDIAVPVS
jgi:hypothetical protein